MQHERQPLVGGGKLVASVKDTDGNAIGLVQNPRPPPTAGQATKAAKSGAALQMEKR